MKKHGEDWNAIACSGVIDRDAGSIKRRYRIIIRDRVSEADDVRGRYVMFVAESSVRACFVCPVCMAR